MYGIFEIAGLRKVRAYDGAEFATIEIALSNVSPVVCYDIDEEHDAADFFTFGGNVYSIERVSA